MLLAYYGVPLLLTTDGGFFALTSDDQVVAAVRQQFDRMRSAAYDRSEVLDSELSVLNSTPLSTVGRSHASGATAVRNSRLTATYLVTDWSIGRRISASGS